MDSNPVNGFPFLLTGLIYHDANAKTLNESSKKKETITSLLPL